MILKVLLIAAVIGIVYFLFIKKKPKVSNHTKSEEKTEADEMVACETCGVYVALSETILSGSKYYCSKECLEKAK